MGIMMETDIAVNPHPAHSQTTCFGADSVTPPTCDMYTDGQSVENALPQTIRRRNVDPTPRWYVIRATRGRAQEVYDSLVGLDGMNLDVYVPRFHREVLSIEDGNPQKVVNEGLIHNGLVFVRTTYDDFFRLTHAQEPYPFIMGLTPYYNHFRKSAEGRDEYLTVPDRQFRDFRTIIESQDVNILIDQETMPDYLNGKKVEVVSGSFKGVTGTLLRWKGLRRVFVKLDLVGTFATGFIRNCDFRVLTEEEAQGVG